MFGLTWKKYLPVIAILLKRSVTGDQTLNMNHTDFKRAAGGRKLKFSFSKLYINNGRISNGMDLSPLAKELAAVLQEGELSRHILKEQQFEFSMNNDFVLTIKNNTPAVTEALAENIAENS
ncbi:MAG: hypothetical protein ACKVOW_11010 [Chitinophagaceae bacterium]